MIDIKKMKSRPWPHVLGVDIGAESIKYVLVRHQAGKYLIERFGRLTNPMGEEADFSRLTEAIQQISIDRKFLKKVRTVIGVSPTNMVVKRENFPASVSSKELKQMVSFDMEKEMNADATGGVVLSDFLALGPAEDKEGQTGYLLVGIFEDEADSLAGAFISSGIVPAKITPHVAALKNLSALLAPEESSGVVGILDIGRNRSTLVILRNGQLDYHRDILVGGGDFTKAITGTIFHEGRAIQFSTQEAEKFKKMYGYPIGYSEGMTFNGAPLTEVGAMMRPVMERLSGEIHRSLGFFIEKHQGEKIRILYLMGGGGQLKHLPQFLSDKIDVPVQSFPVSKSLNFAKIKKQKKLFDEKYFELTGSLAVALETAGPINLLPAPYQKIQKMAGYHRLFNSFLMLMILVLSLLSLYGYREKSLLENEISNLTQRVTHNRTMGQTYNMLQDSIKTVAGQIAAVDQMVMTDENLTQILKLVSNTLPNGLTLTVVKYQKEAAKATPVKAAKGTPDAKDAAVASPQEKQFVEIWGQSNQGKRDIKMAVAEFMLALEKSGHFESVEMTKEMTFPDSLDRMNYEFQLRTNISQ